MFLRSRVRFMQLALCAAVLPGFAGGISAQSPPLNRLTAATEPLSATETAGLLDPSSASLFAVDRGLALPSNLVAPSSFQDLLHQIWQRSATFRRQCARIEAAKTWRVEVITSKPVAGARADTRIQLTDTGGVAFVNLMPRADLVELIGHEMEHIIEQLDGVDLTRCAKRHLDGVRVVDDLRYETARAAAVGRLVAQEFRSHGGAL
jgi:hypothetical protein